MKSKYIKEFDCDGQPILDLDKVCGDWSDNLQLIPYDKNVAESVTNCGKTITQNSLSILKEFL